MLRPFSNALSLELQEDKVPEYEKMRKREEKGMLQLLINLLTPIFEGMGVSPTDVETYAHNLSGYIYAVFGTLLLAVIVMVAARWLVKKDGAALCAGARVWRG